MTSARGDILHITAAEGGGTDRYIRDLAATTAGRHWIWHASAGLDVIEDVAARRFAIPVDDAALARFMRSVGIVHLHGITPDCTTRLDRAMSARKVPYLASLHDLTIVSPDAFSAGAMPAPDAAWIATTHDRLHDAAAVIAPSAFIRDVIGVHYGDVAVEVIAPGVGATVASAAPPAPADFAARAPRRIVAVVGAIGPHKGSALLPAIAARLPEIDAALVVIGYTDTQITRGWVVPGQLYVHGPYEDAALPGWLAAYRADCVLFPNRLPESFSYTLSEAWAAGLPVIAPDEGALGERVAHSGGGWRLAPGFGASEAVELLARLWGSGGAGEAEWAKVKSAIVPGDTGRTPTLAAMAREFDALYSRFAQPPEAAVDGDALTPLAAANLDGFAFRRELVNLADELQRAKAALAEAKPWVAKLEGDVAKTRAWAQKLEHDVEVLLASLGEKVDENRRLGDVRDAFEKLPVVAQKALLKWAFRARR